MTSLNNMKLKNMHYFKVIVLSQTWLILTNFTIVACHIVYIYIFSTYSRSEHTILIIF